VVLHNDMNKKMLIHFAAFERLSRVAMSWTIGQAVDTR
jgi:hypothetical protein